MGEFPNWSIWLILGFMLSILEIIVPGVFMIWWGASAIVVAIAVLCFPDIALSWQLILFASLAVVTTLISWKYQHTRDIKADEENTLNAREHTMLGSQGVIVEILDNGIARGKFGDTTWRVIGKDLKVGDCVQVQQVEGITLFVHKHE